jgi:hypothetical protein
MDILSLVGGGLGGVLRVVPEVMKLVQAKDERKHELEMTKLQIEVEAKRSQEQINVLGAQGENQDVAAQQAIFLEAVKSQGQITGVKWIDAVNSTVRPFLTYWWMILFTVYKTCMIYYAWNATNGLKEFASKIWDSGDGATLAMILSFWFVDRVFKHQKK